MKRREKNINKDMDIIEKIDFLSEELVYFKIAVADNDRLKPVVKQVVPNLQQAKDIMKQYKKEYKFVDIRAATRQEYNDANNMRKVEWNT